MRKAISSLLLCYCAVTLWGREESSRDFRKTVPLPGGRTLRIEHSLGNVNVHTWPKGEVEIVAFIRCTSDSAAEARTCTDKVQILVQETGTEVWVRTQYPHTEIFSGRRTLSYSVSYDVTMPETAPLDIRNRFGGVSVANLHAAGSINNSNGKVSVTAGRGRQHIENAFGDVEVSANDGDLTVVNNNGRVTASDISGVVDIRNRFGDVRVTNAGKGVTINSGNGNVQVIDAGGATAVVNSFGPVTVKDVKSDVNVQNQNGRVEVTGVSGAADLRTSFESVKFSRVGKTLTVHASNSSVTGDTVGESATVETSFGAVDLRGVKGNARATAGNSSIRLANIGGETYAKTTFSGVTIEDAAGPITVENANGSVTVASKAAQRCQPVSLHTSFSPMRITLPRGMGYNVTAKTSFGRIQSQADLTVSGAVGGDSLTGKIAGGGCELRLMNQNGNIDIVN